MASSWSEENVNLINIFFRPGRSHVRNWRKLVLSLKILVLLKRILDLHIRKQNEKHPYTKIIIILVIWACKNICTSAARCAQNLVKDFRNVHLTYVVIEHRIGPSDMYGFPVLSKNLLPVLVYDCKFRYISFRVVMS